MRSTPYAVAIIGAGASGLMAAIAASRVRPHSVLLLEKEARPGRKLLATGNGRCNLLNMQVNAHAFHGGGAAVAMGLLSRISPSDVLRCFADIGLRCREEEQGRVYPCSGHAGSVLDVLRFACARQGVQTICDARAARIERIKEGFRIHTAQGASYEARSLIMAGGGLAAPSLGGCEDPYLLMRSLGHTVTKLLPALSPLKLQPAQIRGLKGVRVHCTLSLCAGDQVLREERGEALFTDYGISGVAAMQLGRAAGEALGQKRPLSLCVRLLDAGAAAEEIKKRALLFSSQTMDVFFTGLLHQRLAGCLLKAVGCSHGQAVTLDAAGPLEALLCAWRLPVLGVMPFAQAQVTAGGVPLSEFDPCSLESQKTPGLFACGEMLDVDADCGGYNLLWAWVSGITAGTHAAALAER